MIPLSILLQADSAPVNSTVEIIKAIGGILSILITFASPFLLAWFNRKMNVVTATTQDTNSKIQAVSLKVDGLLDEKKIADKAAGAKEERDIIDKEDAAENVGKLKEMQKNKDTVTEVKQIKEVIVKTVEDTADETHKKVDKVPDEVVKKLPPNQ